MNAGMNANTDVAKNRSLITDHRSPKQGELARHLYAQEDGHIQFNMPAAGLPEFLIEACRRGDAYELNEAHIASLDESLKQGRPGACLASVVLGILQQGRGQLDRALARFEDLVQREPHPLIYNEMANLCRQQHRYSQALTYRQQAVAMSPENVNLQVGCAEDHFYLRHYDQGLALLDDLWESDRINEGGLSAYLWFAHFVPGMNPDRLAQAHRLWGQRYAPLSWACRHHSNDPDPNRRLRIGYLSSDLYSHCVGYMYDALLQGHHRDQVEVWGYGSVKKPDQMTDYLSSRFDRYRSIYQMPDAKVAQLIQADGIDILVATAGHTEGHRLKVLGYKPAPIQVDWGGIDTTGMAQVDYRFTDHTLDSPASENRYVERSLYLPGGFSHQALPQVNEPVSPLPLLQNGYVTFCCFNNHVKISEPVISLWCQVMQACPGSRMILKSRGCQDPVIAERLRQSFRAGGIEPDRVTLLSWMPPQDHWRCYAQADIALDTYPFNGGVTTFEALWMGIPTVSLVGSLWVARMGLCIMSSVGLGSLAAQSPEQFVAKVQALVAHPQALSQLRQTMRERLKQTDLCNVELFASDLETAYREIWQRWSDRKR